MNTVSVRPHTRRKPSRPQVYIDKHAQLRAENEASKKPKAKLAAIVRKLNALIGRE